MRHYLELGSRMCNSRQGIKHGRFEFNCPGFERGRDGELRGDHAVRFDDDACERSANATAQRQAAETQLAANAILQSREFSFCLLPFNHARTLAHLANRET